MLNGMGQSADNFFKTLLYTMYEWIMKSGAKILYSRIQKCGQEGWRLCVTVGDGKSEIIRCIDLQSLISGHGKDRACLWPTCRAWRTIHTSERSAWAYLGEQRLECGCFPGIAPAICAHKRKHLMKSCHCHKSIITGHTRKQVNFFKMAETTANECTGRIRAL